MSDKQRPDRTKFQDSVQPLKTVPDTSDRGVNPTHQSGNAGKTPLKGVPTKSTLPPDMD